MSVPVFQATITNDSGDIIPSPVITVIIESSGSAATLYSNRAGTTPLGTAGVFSGDTDGFAQFYAAPDYYRITASDAGSGFERTWRYVVLAGDSSIKDINSTGDVWGAANIEYGSNSNGKYWKYPDGLLICTRISPPSALTVNIGAGNVFRSIALGAEAFPATFSSIPSTSVALIANGGDNQSRWLGLDTTTNVSVSNWGTRVVMDSDSGTGDTGYDFMAIGIWK